MSVTLEELMDGFSGAAWGHRTDPGNVWPYQRGLAAVLDRLADERDRVCGGDSAVADWLRSIAHPPAPKSVPDVEGAKADLRGLLNTVSECGACTKPEYVALKARRALAALEGKP